MFFFFKQKTAYEMRISDWSSDVCSSDLPPVDRDRLAGQIIAAVREQEDKEILKLGHRAETTQRHGVGARRARSGVGDGVELLPRAFGGEGPRRGGVEANAIGPPLDRERNRHRMTRRLRHPRGNTKGRARPRQNDRSGGKEGVKTRKKRRAP